MYKVVVKILDNKSEILLGLYKSEKNAELCVKELKAKILEEHGTSETNFYEIDPKTNIEYVIYHYAYRDNPFGYEVGIDLKNVEIEKIETDF